MAVKKTNNFLGPRASLQAPETIYGIVGHPLGHSLSPVLHNWGYSYLDVDAIYLRWDIPPERLAGFITAVRSLPISGVSVTIPHKEKIIPHIDGLTPVAGRVGAVNTLFWQEGRLMGDNTDIAGFIEPLKGKKFDSALILGAGGVARAALAGLQDLGVEQVYLANRSHARGVAMAREFGGEGIEWQDRDNVDCDLIVNATPVGLKGERENDTPFPASALLPGTTVYDLVYNPVETRLLRDARSAGCSVIDGLAMFIGQAKAQCRLWTKKELPTGEGRELLMSFLDK